MAEPAAAAPKWVFLGTDAGKGIYRASWNAATGELGKPELAAKTDRPDFFAMHPQWPILYTVNSATGDLAGLTSFRVDAAHGTLTPLHRVGSHGDGPCAVSVDATGRAAFAANYQGGSFAAYHLGPGGELSDAGDLQCKGNAACGTLGPVKDRQDAPHLHCVVVAPGNDFVLVCDLGDDAIEVIPIAPGKHPMLGKPLRVAARTGSGPRHVAFHPNGRWLYCVHELDCTIDLYDWSVQGGKPALTLRAGSVVSTAAKGSSLAGVTGCEVLVADDGRFVYTCTRGEDSLTVYRVDAKTGLLTEQQRLRCGGKVPRIIAFDPSRWWLLSCNQAAPGSVTVFAHDPATGKLSETPKTFAADTPMFALWV